MKMARLTLLSFDRMSLTWDNERRGDKFGLVLSYGKHLHPTLSLFLKNRVKGSHKISKIIARS